MPLNRVLSHKLVDKLIQMKKYDSAAKVVSGSIDIFAMAFTLVSGQGVVVFKSISEGLVESMAGRPPCRLLIQYGILLSVN